MAYSRSSKNYQLYCYGTVNGWCIHVPYRGEVEGIWQEFTKPHTGETFFETSVQDTLERIFYLAQFGWIFEPSGLERLWGEYLKV